MLFNSLRGAPQFCLNNRVFAIGYIIAFVQLPNGHLRRYNNVTSIVIKVNLRAINNNTDLWSQPLSFTMWLRVFKLWKLVQTIRPVPFVWPCWHVVETGSGSQGGFQTGWEKWRPQQFLLPLVFCSRTISELIFAHLSTSFWCWGWSKNGKQDTIS